MQVTVRVRHTAALATVAIAGLVSAPNASALSNVPDSTWMTNGPVRAITRIGSTIYLGGKFTALVSPTGKRMSVTNLAAVNDTTGAPVNWKPTADATVWALATDGTRVIAGGDFQSIDGARRTRIAALTTSGALSTGFAASADGSVRAVKVRGSMIYVGGAFGIVDGQRRHRVAALTLSGSLAPGFDGRLTFDRTVRNFGFSPDNSQLYVVGEFFTADGVTRQHVARVSATTGALDRWTPQEEHFASSACGGRTICDWAQNVRTVSGHVFVGFCGGKNRLDSLDPVTGALQWRMWTSGDVKSMTLWNGHIIIGGHFHHMHFDGSSTVYDLQYLAELAYTGVPNTAWRVHLDDQQGTWDGMYALETDGNGPGSHLWVGGAFQDTFHTFGGQNYLARFTA